ncbi:hypothetical protein D3C80_1000950 [compost metagenome]
MTIRVERQDTIVVIRFARIVGNITRIVQIGIQHLIATGDVQHAAVGQHHAVSVNLTQTQCQFRTVIHGDGIGIELRRFFRQRGQAIAVQIKAIRGNGSTVTNIQRRTVSHCDAVREKTRVFHVDLRVIIHRQLINVRGFTRVPLGTVIQRHVEHAALIHLFARDVTVAVERGIRPDTVR